MSVSSSYPHTDPSNSKNRIIDTIIGAEHYYRYIYGNRIRRKINKLTTIESLFGWVFTGYYHKISTTNNFDTTRMLCVNSEICAHSSYEKVLNFDSDTKFCVENENDYIENFKTTLKFHRKRDQTSIR